MHLAAYTAVDRAETEEATCFEVNAAGTESMSLAANEIGAHLMAISTDYVFDGNKGGAYVEEDDATNPLNVYGASKRAGRVALFEQRHHRAHIVGHGRARQERRPRDRRASPLGLVGAIRQ